MELINKKKGNKSMKAIINSKLYNTTTSSVIYAGGTEALFKTENGAYFKTSNIGIIPMTEDEVKEWLGVIDADTYIKEFGTVESA